MDERTGLFYQVNALALFKAYNQAYGGIGDYFSKAFLSPSRILDIGCGSCRDIINLLEMGHDPYGTEPCDKLRVLAEEKWPILKGRILDNALPDLKMPFGGGFDGIVCSGVLQHILHHELEKVALSFEKNLAEKGKALISFPLKRDDVKADNRDLNGRLFTDIKMPYFVKIMNESGFLLLETWENKDALGRVGFLWQTTLFEKAAN